jgi:hypothetical protein
MNRKELSENLWKLFHLGSKYHSQICEMEDEKETKIAAVNLIAEILDELDIFLNLDYKKKNKLTDPR